MKKTFLAVAALTSVLAIGGCASKKYVDQQVNKALTSEIGDVRMEVNEIREDIKNQESEVKSHQDEIQHEIQLLKIASKEQEDRMKKEIGVVQDALKRAEKTYKGAAKGKLLYEVTISDEAVGFAYDKSKLSDQAKAALDVFAKVLIQENEGVFIEIQGHTDNIGSEKYNLKLGQARADAVRSYLHVKHNLPLHHMSTFSYGESKPAGPNDTKSNRAKNRRVMMIVME